MAAGCHQLSGSRHFEIAVAGVGQGAVGLQNLEVPLTSDRQIQRILGVDHVALDVELLGGHHAHTGSQHQAGGGLRGRRSLAARLTDVLVQQVIKDRAIPLEAGGVDVGQIVRDHVHTCLLRVQARLGDPH